MGTSGGVQRSDLVKSTYCNFGAIGSLRWVWIGLLQAA